MILAEALSTAARRASEAAVVSPVTVVIANEGALLEVALNRQVARSCTLRPSVEDLRL